MSPRRYLRLTLAATLAATATILLVNWQVDPFSLGGAASAGGRPAEDADATGASFLQKAFAVRRAGAAAVILGTSRSDFGLMSGHPGFPAAARPVYNLSLGGVSIAQMRDLLVHAQHAHPLRVAVIGLDLESFLPGGRTDFDRAVLAGNPESAPEWMSRARLDLSWRALAASTGLRPVRETAEVQETGVGHRQILQIREFENFHSRLPQLFPRRDYGDRWDTDPHRAASMRAFAELLAYARRESIDLRLFISPVHARYLELYRRVGWWPLFESWKRALAAALAEEAGQEPGRIAFPLWDFSGFNDLTMEAVPPATDLQTRMRWYRDSSHYSREHGSLILDRVLNHARQDATPAAPVVRVDTKNIEAHLGRQRLDAYGYRVTHGAEIADAVSYTHLTLPTILRV